MRKKRKKMQEIVVKNLSTVISDASLSNALPAFQRQVSEHFCSAYGVDAKLALADKTTKLPVGSWLLGVFDDADQAGALGYHDITSRGDPLGKVFAKTTKDDGGIWSVTFSHELLEMLGDPGINLCAMDDERSRVYAYEVCDACEADEFGYEIDGVRVSDFVLPSFFEPGTVTGQPRDFCGHLKDCFEMLPGGYLSYLDFESPKGWQQEFASRSPAMRISHKGHGLSRFPKRGVSASARVRSTAE